MSIFDETVWLKKVCTDLDTSVKEKLDQAGIISTPAWEQWRSSKKPKR
jgi:hypothetical protein